MFATERKTIPKGYYRRAAGRSGVANFKGIFAFNSTVDSEYRGNIYVVKIGNRIGQFIRPPTRVDLLFL